MVQSVDRALDVLIRLGAGPLGVGEVALALQVDKSTASRLLSTLLDRNFVRRDPISGRYRLGFRTAELGQAFFHGFRLGNEVRPQLERISAACGETVLLTEFEGGEAVYIDKLESLHSLRTHSRIGQRAPLHCGASGKSITAFLPAAEARQLLEGRELASFTAHTVTDLPTLLAQLKDIRRQGYALSVAEINEGVMGIGVPLLDWQGRPLGAISVTGPMVRMTGEQIPQIVALLRQAAADFGRSGRPLPNRTASESVSRR